MKELSIEEKAKAYDGNYKAYTELISRLEDVKDAIKKQNYGIAMDILCQTYPVFQFTISTEHEESEDERVRNKLIEFFKGYSPDEEWWGNITQEDILAWLGKQGEQRPADKVEPKFKVGDWVAYNHNPNLPPRKIIQITNEHYVFNNSSFDINTLEEDWHLWTIQDAKDGDILFQDLMGGKTFIYNGVNPDMAILYSFIISNDGEDVLPYHIGKPNTGIGNIEESKNIIHPATKEQRDLLFQKMKEAGYEWDANKKEIKKIPIALEECKIEHIECGKYYYCIKDYYSGGCKRASKGEVIQALGGMSMMGLGVEANEYFIPVKCIVDAKPSWDEEDDIKLKSACAFIRNTSLKGNESIVNSTIDWLKSLKERVQPQPKSEWSKEDENRFNNLIFLVECSDENEPTKNGFIDFINRLKSLRPQSQWKPSDEQMKALSNAGNSFRPFEEGHKVLWSLYNDLKKLREE